MFQMVKTHAILLKFKRLFHLVSNLLRIGPNVVQSLGVQETVHEIHLHRPNRNLVSSNKFLHFRQTLKLLVHFIRVEMVLVRWQNFENSRMNLLKFISIFLLDVSGAPLMGMTIYTSQNCNEGLGRFFFKLVLIVVCVFVFLVLIKHLFILFQKYN